MGGRIESAAAMTFLVPDDALAILCQLAHVISILDA